MTAHRENSEVCVYVIFEKKNTKKTPKNYPATLINEQRTA